MARRNWLDVVIAPLRWVERARGWRRVALLAAYLIIALVVIGPLLREASLWRIPSIAEPVDRAKYGHIDLPDADNAAILYAEAADLLRPRQPDYPQAHAVAGRGAIPTWSITPPELQDWVETNTLALGRWLAGTERPNSLGRQPIENDGRPARPSPSEMRALILLGMMAASRREEAGDLAGAWPYHLGVIRSAGHLQRHVLAVEAMHGATILRQAVIQVRSWIDDDRQTAAILRQASRDLAAARTLLPTTADLIRLEYFDAEGKIAASGGARANNPVQADERMELAILARASGLVEHLLSNEPRRSLRILRLLTAGQLAQVDRPEVERPALVSSSYLVYEIDDHTPGPLRAIRPEALVTLADSSACHDHFRDWGFFLRFIQGGNAALEGLVYHAAERAYALDHGGQPPRTFADLVPAYLDALPEGVGPGYPIAAP